jgi:hypothetical protein
MQMVGDGEDAPHPAIPSEFRASVELRRGMFRQARAQQRVAEVCLGKGQ